MLFSALDKPHIGATLQMHYFLTQSRLVYAGAKQQVSSLGKDFSELSDACVAMVQQLSQQVEALTKVSESAGVQKAFDMLEQYDGATYGVRKVKYNIFSLEVQAAISASNELLSRLFSTVASRMHVLSDKLQADIPVYSEYVIDSFVTEKVQSELIDKSWDHLAMQWVALSKMSAAASSLHAPSLGDFPAAQQSVHSFTERVLVSGKTFICVVSTVQLILTSLPAAPKAMRATMIFEHIGKVKAQGGVLPTNLREYLVKEYKKNGGRHTIAP